MENLYLSMGHTLFIKLVSKLEWKSQDFATMSASLSLVTAECA
jgi:hypothetical protein